MKVQQILYSFCLVALVLPIAASAQIYKWKDKDGVMRYSDMPPPPNVEVKTIGTSAKDPYARAKASEAAGTQGSVKNSEAGAVAPPDKKNQVVESFDAKQEQAGKAEMERQKKLEQQKQAKIDAENCSAARANYEAYLQGGRVFKINEKGEREFMSDEDLAAGKAKAQAEVDQYCK
ncbi:MAG: DUF4124 domain-containing protein [Methylotenera sp.]